MDKFTRIEPAGTRTCGTMHGPIDLPCYPQADEDFGRLVRDMRTASGLGLGECARRAGLKPVRLCDVERGALRPDDKGWLAWIAEQWEVAVGAKPVLGPPLDVGETMLRRLRK